MRIRTAWILALLCLIFGLTLASAAQQTNSEGRPEDNACYTGGSLEGKCDWPTDAEDEWAWDCGWYVARVDTGVFTVYDVPEWCNYFVAPRVICYDSFMPGQRDFILTGALNTVSNASGYLSLDGTCTGGVAQTETLVTGSNALDATATCQSLLGLNYVGVSMNALGYNTPASWYGCMPVVLT